MRDMPPEVLLSDPYEEESLPSVLQSIQDRLMVPAEKFIWISPEYNGSFPGVLKLFIDALSVRNYEGTFPGKKSALIGVTTGRSGNIRGLDHLAGILIHMKSVIYPWLLPISMVSNLVDTEGRIIHDPTMKTLDSHIRGFLTF